MAKPEFRVGIDVGGTFTDVAAYDVASGNLVSFKVPSTPPELAHGVIAGLRVLLAAQDGSVRELVHGTTVATNAILEGRGSPTALITTRGFRDVLEIGRQSRHDLYDLDNPGRARPLVPRRRRFEVAGRLDHLGSEVEPLATAKIPGLVDAVRASGAVSVAICLLHSYANFDHECRLRDELTKHFDYVSASHEINAEFREYERSNTTVLNAYIMPIVSQYVTQLEEDLAELDLGGRLHVVQSNGGMMTPGTTRRKPINTVMSGPAAGIAASRHLLEQMGIQHGVTFDMGGTSTDVCVIYDSAATVTSQRKIGDQPARLASVSIETIGAGGGSLAWIDPAGALKVGPQSAGALPGPACYGRGGTDPTVTDADLVLGYLDDASVWGGEVRIDRDLSEQALGRFADRYGFSTHEAGEGIVAIANSNMIRALRLVSVQKGYDLREFALVAFGGAGPVHAGRLAQELHIPRVVVPVLSGVFSAYGCLVADVRYDAVQTYFSRLSDAEPVAIERAFRELEERTVGELVREGYGRSAISVSRAMDLRYLKQNYEIEVSADSQGETPDLAVIRGRFDARHEQLYAYRTNQDLEIVNLRVFATVATGHPPLPAHSAGTARSEDARRGERLAYFSETGHCTLPIYDRAELGVGAVVAGPAAVEEPWSTTVVYPGQRLVVDQFGNLVIEVPSP
ncbi:MAG: hydantoinase/oxoprolinase family protein [Chloroflexi bacterium]|nr:hydantoinase/oxoprolinase family protein [Chloroflexota bacterium]